MAERSAIALAISVGWGVRTFLQSDVLPTLLAHHRVVVLSPPDLGAAVRDRWGDRLTVDALHPFDLHRGAVGSAYRRYSATFHRLSATNTRRFNQREHRPKTWRRRLMHTARGAALGFGANLERLAQRRRALRRAVLDGDPHVEAYRRLFARHGIRAVIPTVAYLAPESLPAIVARDAGLATGCWVNSWDNLTSKGPFLDRFDRYFVWSAAGCAELERYYPESRGRRCTATGVPHFDGYHRADVQWRRARFARAVGLDPDRPIILYGACTPFLAPHEHLVVERLADDLPRLDGRPQLLVRLHPGDDGRRFNDLGARPDVCLQTPGAAREGRRAGLGGFCPTEEENGLAINTVRHADVVINIASTISLEGALADRPTINVAYDLAPGAPDGERIAAYYDFEHYRTVLDHGAVTVARNPDALLDQVRTALADPRAGRAGRAALAAHWCGPPGDGAGQRLGTALVDWLAEVEAP